MIDVNKLVENIDGWVLTPGSDMLESEGIKVRIYRGEVADAALGADLLIGLGGTANQLCAGLGVPVVSILEKGKLIQKKLLKEAEILVKAEPQELAKAAERILSDPELKKSMKEAGIRNLGGFGALDHVVEYCASALGWDNRCAVYEKYRSFIEKKSGNGSPYKKEMLPGE
jgi:tetraacyldisaccharide 4'-kinase